MAAYSLGIQDEIIAHIFDNSLVLWLHIPQVKGLAFKLVILGLKNRGPQLRLSVLVLSSSHT